MMKLNGEALQEKAFHQIEAAAAAELAELRAALAQVADPCQRDAIAAAALGLAGAWADAALLVGFQMARNPGAWLFQPAGTEE
jgi:hypothetical protein